MQAQAEVKGRFRQRLFVTDKVALRKLSTSPQHNQFSDRDSSRVRGRRGGAENKSCTPNARNRTASPNDIVKDLQSLYRKDVLPDAKHGRANWLCSTLRTRKVPAVSHKLKELTEYKAPAIISGNDEKGKRRSNLRKTSPVPKKSQKKAANFNFTIRNHSPKTSKHRNEEEMKLKVDDLILSYIKKGMMPKTKA